MEAVAHIEEQRPPGPRGHKLIGCLLDVRQDRLKFVEKATREFGDLVCFMMGPKRLYLLSHPDHIKHVLCNRPENFHKGLGLEEAKPLLGQGLLTSEGDLWARQRRQLQTIFRGTQMDGYGGVMIDVIPALLARWRELEDLGRPVEVHQEMARFTLTILGKTMFGADLEKVADEVAADLGLITSWAMTRMTAFIKIPWRLPTPRNWRAQRALRRLNRVVDDLLAGRLSTEQGGEWFTHLKSRSDASGDAKAGDQQIRDEVMTLLLAGYETTAATLTWTFYLLSQHAEVERRLHQEIDSVIGDRCPGIEDLPRLVYTRMIIEEVLRLYPPVWLIPRRALAEDCIGGYTIPAGSDVLLSIYSMHRHPEFWSNPDQFDPNRFSTDQKAQQVPQSYMPFGAGPRVCLGSRFGMMEAILVLTMITQKYRLELSYNRRIEPVTTLTLQIRDGLTMRLRRRESKSG